MDTSAATATPTLMPPITQTRLAIATSLAARAFGSAALRELSAK